MVGTRRQWEPFWENERPSMADVILEQRSEAEIRELYGEHWRRSNLIDGAYEAEVFFPKLGDGGRWCWFTATPLKTADGTVVGAIETFWDTTENRRTETECRMHVKELEEKERALSQIIQGSTTPTFVINRNHIVTHWNRALEKLTGFDASEIVGTNHHWKPFRKQARPIMADVILDQLETGEISHYYGANWRPSTAHTKRKSFSITWEKRAAGFSSPPHPSRPPTEPPSAPSKPCGTPPKTNASTPSIDGI
jgi:PAS domain S-box-containing protein